MRVCVLILYHVTGFYTFYTTIILHEFEYYNTLITIVCPVCVCVCVLPHLHWALVVCESQVHKQGAYAQSATHTGAAARARR